MYRNRITGAYPRSRADIQADHPLAMLPEMLSADDLAHLGEDEVFPSQPPAFDSSKQKVIEGDPAKTRADTWVQTWVLVDLSEAELAANLQRMVRNYDDALTANFDAVAQAKGYDTRITCTMRAGYTGPYQSDGIAFAQWMDACNAAAYKIMSDVQGGRRYPPNTPADLIAELPKSPWPIGA